MGFIGGRSYFGCMSDHIAVLALRRKCDQISSIIAKYERKIKEARADLAHVTAALRLFEVTSNAQELPPNIDLDRLFKRGETTAICMKAHVDEKPLDTRELTLRMRVHNGKLDKPRCGKVSASGKRDWHLNLILYYP
jgi:hypothetical protein